MKKKEIILFLSAVVLVSFLSIQVSAWNLNKQLIQTEVDPNFPCHVEGLDTIVCPAVSTDVLSSIKSDLASSIVNSKLIGNIIDDTPIDNSSSDVISVPTEKFTDEEKQLYLDENAIPYQRGNYTKAIDVSREYREKVDLNNMQPIDIGFNSNYFQVMGTPSENFLTNQNAGFIQYIPLNNTWLVINGSQFLDYLSLSTIITLQSNFTASIWFQLNSTSEIRQGIMGFGSTSSTGWGFGINLNDEVNGTMAILYGAVGYNNAGVVSDKNWHNFVLKTDNSSASTMFLDGVNIYNGTPRNMVLPTTGTYLGGMSNKYSINGSIDEFRLYNTTLTNYEIQRIYAQGRIRNISVLGDANDSSLLSYISFNENQGSVVKGLYGKINATFTGHPLWKNDAINVSTLGYPVTIPVFNITLAAVWWDNGTILNNSVFLNSSGNYTGNFSGNVTFTFYPAQTLYIRDYFNNATFLNLGQSSPSLTPNRSFFDTYTAFGGSPPINMTYVNDSNNIGFVNGHIFDLAQMSISGIGNLTYRFLSDNYTYSASVVVATIVSGNGIGGNTSIWYSLNGTNFFILNSTITSGINMSASIPLNNVSQFFVRFQSDTHSLANDNPIDWLNVSYISALDKGYTQSSPVPVCGYVGENATADNCYCDVGTMYKDAGGICRYQVGGKGNPLTGSLVPTTQSLSWGWAVAIVLIVVALWYGGTRHK